MSFNVLTVCLKCELDEFNQIWLLADASMLASKISLLFLST